MRYIRNTPAAITFRLPIDRRVGFHRDGLRARDLVSLRQERTSDAMRPIERNARLFAFTTLAAAVIACSGGCQGMGSRRVATAEPGLGGGIEPGSSVAAAPSTSPSWVDRHPLFSKPRDMYASTNSNKLVKTAAATVVGVPVGFFGEIRQIVVGKPSDSPKY